MTHIEIVKEVFERKIKGAEYIGWASNSKNEINYTQY